jgi:hypothetical protein
MAFFPLVTWVMMDFSLRPPRRYCSRASFSRVFSGMITFCPPAWQAAQLALKICSPFSTFEARAGWMAIPKATAPAVAACSDYEDDNVVRFRVIITIHELQLPIRPWWSIQPRPTESSNCKKSTTCLTFARSALLTEKAEAVARRVAATKNFMLTILFSDFVKMSVTSLDHQVEFVLGPYLWYWSYYVEFFVRHRRRKQSALRSICSMSLLWQSFFRTYRYRYRHLAYNSGLFSWFQEEKFLIPFEENEFVVVCTYRRSFDVYKGLENKQLNSCFVLEPYRPYFKQFEYIHVQDIIYFVHSLLRSLAHRRNIVREVKKRTVEQSAKTNKCSRSWCSS